ncbi:MAG: acetyl-CoA carboxylase biotin carboxyl carrier protein subunit [Winogradskyella sp.]|nr:MAG: acetyl-CoA carboxylase biotin carboxyl carrier protein subunit [Winogradskyella sp.]
MYKIKVNNTHSFNVTKEDIDKLDAVETNKNQFHVLNNDTSIEASILESDFNKKMYEVKVNSNTYSVVIQDELDQLISELGFEVGASKKVNDIKAPMPGLILEISVGQGQEVKENDALLILEAMKMENVINSPRDGVIKSIAVKQGDTVDKNNLLISFE